MDGARFAWLVAELPPVTLSEADTIRAGELRGERGQQFFRGRAALAAALGEAAGGVLEASPARCPDCGRRHGGPELAEGRFASVSHAGDGSLAAVADVPVGVDVEERGAAADIRPAMRLPPGEDDALQHWTRVEAVLKADGRGLRIDPAAVEFSRLPTGGLRARVPGGAEFDVQDLAVPGDYVAAIAVRV